MSDTTVTHEFQYSSAEHQASTAVSGMWLFLASEVLFFGALFLSWIYSRHWNQAGFDAGGQQTSLAIGTINTVILLTSSFVYSVGLAFIRSGNSRPLVHCCALAWLLGLTFLILKFGVEWPDDIERGLFPGPGFSIGEPLTGGAKLFFVFYFFGTALHGLHMLGGLGIVGWIIHRTRRGDFSLDSHTPVTVAGLYWSFVDIVWVVLYPLIYLIGRGP